MSNKSSTSVISLPQGGGAQKGIGEKFSPDLFTGTGNFTVPIALPPGRNGFQPELSLVYSTGNGNSPYGLGWSLSIPGVSRKTSEGIPRYRDYAPALKDRDVFILSGAEDLVPLPDITASPTRYRPRTEGLFARIEHHHTAGKNHWEVRSKDGLVSFYGTPESSEDDPAVIADPADRSKIYCWKLSRTEDPFGNRIEYEYERDAGEDGPHHWDELYLKRLRYVDYGEGGTTKFLVSVTFHYEDRPDPFSDYRAGFEIRARKRCTHIEVRTHADEERLVRTYHLIYLDQRADSKVRPPLNGVSLLNQVKVVGHDGDRTEELPPLEFGYSQFNPEKKDFFPLQGRDLPAHSLGSPDTEMVDLFGNGLPDIMQMNGTIRYWRNLGNGQFDLPREMKEAPAGLQLGDPGVQMIDADGDGRTDLLVTANGLSGYFPLRFGGLWDRRSFQKHKFAPSFNLQDPEVKLVDLDGDGVTDAIRSGTRLECFFNDPKEGWNDTRLVERRDLEVFPNVNFSDSRVRFSDMSGDGMQDIVLIHDGNVEYWPNLGYGNWGKRIHMRNSPRFPRRHDPRRILVGDVDGDGLADIVYIDHGKVLLYINQSGNSWSDPIEIDGTPDTTDMDAVRLADMLGSGLSGVLWSRDAAEPGRETLFFLDFTSGNKPYVLHEMNNHLGALTRVEYAPSTRFYLEDQKRLETRWKTPLPFPVQVVAGVEVIDEISGGKLTTEYSYHHGYWDGAEREFRGFGRVDQRDTEVFENFHASGLHPNQPFEAVDPKMFSPPLETHTWFHQGPIGDEFGDWEEADYGNEYFYGDPNVLARPAAMTDFLKSLPRRVKRDALRTLRGSILRTELYALDGSARQDRPFTVTESLTGVREEAGPGDDDFRIFLPHALAQRTTQWERGDDPMTQFSFTDDYDAYGIPRKQFGIAVPHGRDYTLSLPATETPEPYLSTLAVSDLIHRDDATHYLIGRMARATSFEVKNDGRQSVFELADAIRNGEAETEIIGQTLTFYDGAAFEGLPFGEIGDFGVPVRTETLVLTEEILREAYKSGDTVLDPPEMPPYLVPGAEPNWTDEYPQEFREKLPALAGYVFHEGGEDSPFARGYFTMAQRQHFDFQDDPAAGRGLALQSRDPFGNDSSIEYDEFDFLPVKATDAIGLTTQAVYDYRALQPRLVIDPNGNRSAFAFSPLGLVTAKAVMGKEGENAGDTLEAPGSRLEYDFFAFMNRRQPVFVRTIARQHHVNDTDVPLPERDETIETIEYSDGFGRLLQTRTQAEEVIFGNAVFGDAVGLPADQSQPVSDAVGRQLAEGEPPRVIVSGLQIYNNKSWVVEQFEPFFSQGYDYLPPAQEELGQKVQMFYDPRGQVIRTLNPDGSEQVVILGVPENLSNPKPFMPTPWETFTYDANDNAGRTHTTEAVAYRHHWNTPASVRVDARGRTIESVARNGPDPDKDWFVIRSTYDIRGNLLTVTDALGREAFHYVYNLIPPSNDNDSPMLRIESIDAGLRRMVFDAAGNEIERRDSKGALMLQVNDALLRPIRQWARDGIDQPLTLREHLIYGDSAESGLTLDQAQAVNLLGQLYHHYDEAGLVTIEQIDFKGNVLEKIRRVISDETILSVFDPPSREAGQVRAFRVDWQPIAGISLADHANTLLDSATHRTSMTYDGLNRVKTMLYPQDVEGERKLLQPRYNRAGALEAVELDGTTYVERIAYSARGQRILIAYGNGIMTRYAYDPLAFRLQRMRTEGYSQPKALTYHSEGNVLQDCAYEYDLVGNIQSITDRTRGSGIQDNPQAVLIDDSELRALVAAGDALMRQFTYDPIYRLTFATGRECKDNAPAHPFLDAPRCGFNSGSHGTPNQDNAPNLTGNYSEEYTYDAMGNMLELRHSNNGNGFTRGFEHQSGNNRLQKMTIGETDYDYTYDANGNMTAETSSRHFEWDHSDQMKVFRNQVDSAEPSVHAHYLYDADGMRIKKLVRKHGGQVEATVYIDGIFEQHSLAKPSEPVKQNNSLHVMDDTQRIALIRVGEVFTDDNSPAIQFHLGDHLGSSNLVMSDSGNWVNREEYTPYGETSLGSFARKRYRFTGKERDGESGLNYHGARYFGIWLANWLSVDPIFRDERSNTSKVINLFKYSLNNPILYVDPNGLRVYILVNTSGRDIDVAAIYQREKEIKAFKSYDPQKDNVYIIDAYDLGKIEQQIKDKITDAQKKGYGKTVEFSVWGHAGIDGPKGFYPTTGRYALDKKQLTLAGWSRINFNWADESYAIFFGCHAYPFAKSFLEQQMQKGLTHSGGYNVSSYPSLSPRAYKVPSPASDIDRLAKAGTPIWHVGQTTGERFWESSDITWLRLVGKGGTVWKVPPDLDFSKAEVTYRYSVFWLNKTTPKFKSPD